ncbi:MAG: GIY-YIG nuclease family protein [Sulfuricurvum sp.]|jgi:putative endonuclease
MSTTSTTPYTLYLLRCSDGTLYTGITIDIKRRIDEHNTSAKGAKYTKSRRPCILVYNELLNTKSAALKREMSIKKMTKAQKESLLLTSTCAIL